VRPSHWVGAPLQRDCGAPARFRRLRNAAATGQPRARKDLDVDPRFASPPPDLAVLVTGGAGGIGAVIARAFHEAGSRVHVCDIDRAALDRLNADVPGITGSMADASVADDVDLVFDDVQGTSAASTC
jgi:NADPH-dependent 2,4-dienoyl-CoA reductase/sulfur reductase-like enzyme